MTNVAKFGRKLVVEMSTNVIEGLYDRLGLVTINNQDVQKALQDVVAKSLRDPSWSQPLWDGCLESIARRCGRAHALAFEKWARNFPSDTTEDTRDITSWATVWPELTNRLRKTNAFDQVLTKVSDLYWTMTENGSFGSFLDQALRKQLSSWDKEVITACGGADLSEERYFFEATLAGSQRQELAAFWALASADLSEEQKRVIWQAGNLVWLEENADLTDEDFAAMRTLIADDKFYEWASGYIRGKSRPVRNLPDPDSMLKYVARAL